LRRLGLFAVLLVAIGIVGPGHPAIRAQGQSPPSRFRAGVDLVEVSVLVRDRDGKLVTDLAQEELTLLEDGVAQPIVAFERVALPVVRPAAAREAARHVAKDVATNEAPARARVFVLVLDSNHVTARRAQTVKTLARQFIENQVGPDDYVAVFSPGGIPSATQDFTTDKARLLAAVDHFTGMKMASAVLEIDQEKRAVDGVPGAVPMHDGRDPSDGERMNRALALVSTLEALSKHLERIPGQRKSLLLFSEGVDYDQGDVLGKVQRNASEVMRGMSRAMGALMRTNVALYAVDPRALNSADADLLETPLYMDSRPRTDTLSTRTFTDEQRDSIRVLRQLSESTGGFAAVNLNDFTGAFERILAESSSYYLIGYSPEHIAKPGEFRSITVKVARPGMTVSARHGYLGKSDVVTRRPADIAASDPSPAFPVASTRARGRVPEALTAPPAPATTQGLSAPLQALLASPLPQPGLPIRVQAIPMRAEGRKTEVRLVVEVLGRGLQFAERDGRFSERVELALLTVNEGGRAANGTSIDMDLRLTPEDLARVKGTGVRWLSSLELPPGRHQLRVAGRAERTGITGLLTHDIVVPARRDGYDMSGVTITSVPSVLMVTKGKPWLEQALPTPPTAARAFVSGDQMVAAVAIYRPERGAAAGAGAVAVAVDRADGSPSGIADRRTLTANGPRVEEIGFPVSTTKLPAGRYVLRVTLDAPGSERLERAVPFEIVGR
jgi:VWFA-related protein